VSALTEKLAETTARRIDWIMKTRRRRKRCETKNSYTKYKITYRRVSKSIVCTLQPSMAIRRLSYVSCLYVLYTRYTALAQSKTRKLQLMIRTHYLIASRRGTCSPKRSILAETGRVKPSWGS